MKSYFAYIRVSTVKQGEHGSSLQEQRDSIEAYTRRTNLTISRWFEEMETAAKQGRSAFNRMLAEIDSGAGAGIIIHKIDRSARNLRDWARLGELMDRGVEVHFVHDNLDLSTRGGRLSADIQAVVAADFIRNLRDEVRKGRYGRLKQGFFPLPAPTGYLNCGSAKPKQIHPVRGPLVREAFELYGTGTYSVDTLRIHLASRGLTTGAGSPLPPSHVTRMLRNPFYMGIMRLSSTGETFPGNHEPLISAALFKRVQEVLSGRLYPRTQIHRFLYRRIIKCGDCGRSLTGERQKGHVYYRCHSHSCRGTSVSERSVEGRVHATLQTLCFDEEDVGDFRDVLKEVHETEAADASIEKERLARDLALVQQRLERLTDAVLDGMIDKEAYEARKVALLTRQQELRDRQTQGSALTKAETLAERFELAFAALHGFLTGSDEEKRELLGCLGSNLVVRGKTVEFPLHSPFAELQKWSSENDSWPHRGAVRTTTRDSRTRKLRRFVRNLVRGVTGAQTAEDDT